MQVQKAERLGALHRILGIAPESRVTYQFTPTGGVIIVDLTAGVQHQVEGQNVDTKHLAINPRITELLGMTSRELKAVWNAGPGWDDERELVFTELCERGVNVLANDVL